MISFIMALLISSLVGALFGVMAIESFRNNMRNKNEDTMLSSIFIGIGLVFIIIAGMVGISGVCDECGEQPQMTRTFECLADNGTMIWSQTLDDDHSYFEDDSYAYTYAYGSEPNKHVCRTAWKVIESTKEMTGNGGVYGECHIYNEHGDILRDCP